MTVVVGYQFSNTASDLTGSSVNKALVTSGATAGSWSGQALGSLASVTASYFTPAADPGTTGITVGTITVKLNVTTGNTNLQAGITLSRVNSAGTVQASTALSTEQTAAAGVLTFTFTDPAIGTWASGDRLRVDVRLRNTTTMTNQAATITYASADCSLHAPWIGAASRWNYGDKADNHTLSLSDLKVTQSANSSYSSARSTVSQTTGKYYFEFTPDTLGAAQTVSVGVANATMGLGGGTSNTTIFVGSTTNGLGWYDDGSIWTNNATATSVAAFSAGTTNGVAIDLDNDAIWFRVGAAGNWNNSGTANPATNTGGISISGLGAVAIYAAVGTFSVNEAVTVNFGASAYVGAVPSGFANFDGSVGGIAKVRIVSQARVRAAFW